jgi:NAD(P)-dependent dehydrogenase (short-subunit alcohol dehydrogenase family)
LLIAEVYGLRGASVAVLDVRELEVGEARGVEFYKCDVGDREQVESVAKEIEEDVGSPLCVLRPQMLTVSCDTKQLGTPTILINNAAIAHGKSILDLSHDEIEQYVPSPPDPRPPTSLLKPT